MPVPKVRGYKKGPSGIATLTKTETKVTVVFEGSGDTYDFPIEGDRITCDVESIKPGKVFAALSADKTKLQSVRPASGTYRVKFVSLAKGENQPPTPKHYEGMGRRGDGTTFPYSFYGFTVLLEVTKGPWAGTIVTNMLRYLFVDAGDGETAGIRQGGKNSSQLIQFLELAGLDLGADTIPLSDNVLPWLEKRLASSSMEFMVVINDGWIQSFAPPLDE
jgi:hypothetical protein